MSNQITPQEIKGIVQKSDMSRTQVAAIIGVSEVTIWRWMEGRSSPHRIFVRELRKLEKQNNRAGS